MKNFTKEERYNLYVLALEKIKDGRLCFMCNALTYESTSEDIVNATNFPELFKHKPDKLPGGKLTGAWFDIEPQDMEKRIKILEQCVEETK